MQPYIKLEESHEEPPRLHLDVKAGNTPENWRRLGKCMAIISGEPEVKHLTVWEKALLKRITITIVIFAAAMGGWIWAVSK